MISSKDDGMYLNPEANNCQFLTRTLEHHVKLGKEKRLTNKIR